MKDNSKYKSEEDFFHILNNDIQREDELEIFEREAIEGWKMVEDQNTRRKSLHTKAELLFSEGTTKTKSNIIYWMAAAASLVIVIGLVFILGPKLNSGNDEVAQVITENDTSDTINEKLDEHTNTNEIQVNSDSVLIKPFPDEKLKRIEKNKTASDVPTPPIDDIKNLEAISSVSEKDRKYEAENTDNTNSKSNVTTSGIITADDMSDKEKSTASENKSEIAIPATNNQITYNWSNNNVQQNNFIETNSGVNKKILKRKNTKSQETVWAKNLSKGRKQKIKSEGLVSNQGIAEVEELYLDSVLPVQKTQLNIQLINKTTNGLISELNNYPGGYSAFVDFFRRNIQSGYFMNNSVSEIEFSIDQNGVANILPVSSNSQNNATLIELERTIRMMPKWRTDEKNTSGKSYLLKISVEK